MARFSDLLGSGDDDEASGVAEEPVAAEQPPGEVPAALPPEPAEATEPAEEAQVVEVAGADEAGAERPLFDDNLLPVRRRKRRR